MDIHEITLKDLLDQQNAEIARLTHSLEIANSTIEELREQIAERDRRDRDAARRLRDCADSLLEIAGSL